MPRLKSRRDATPLLAPTSSQASSENVSPKPTHKGLRRLLFASSASAAASPKVSKTPLIAAGTQQRRRLDTRSISVPSMKITTVATAGTSTTQDDDDHIVKGKPQHSSKLSATTTATTVTPPRALRENSRDSQKKNRPLVVPVRKLAETRNPSARDPPARCSESFGAPSQEEDESASSFDLFTQKPLSAYVLSEKDDVSSTTASSSFDERRTLASERSAVDVHRQTSMQSAGSYEVLFARQPPEDDLLRKYELLVVQTQNDNAVSQEDNPLVAVQIPTNLPTSMTGDAEPPNSISAPPTTSMVDDTTVRHHHHHARLEYRADPNQCLQQPITTNQHRPPEQERFVYSTVAGGTNNRPSGDLQSESSIPILATRPTADSGDVGVIKLKPGHCASSCLRKESKIPKREEKTAVAVSTSTGTETKSKPAGGFPNPSTTQYSRKPLSKTKALLSRPFGRTSLPPEIARKWVVEVSSAEWDADEKRWKYRILVQRRQLTTEEEQRRAANAGKDLSIIPSQSFTAAFTWRSLGDFIWLERALQQEYGGGLLVPSLSGAVQRPLESNTEEMPIEAENLRHWLSDVMNGVRGQGELIFDHDHIDLLRSESMEAFLYRNSGPLAAEIDAASNNEFPYGASSSPTLKDKFQSILHSMDMLCIGPKPLDTTSTVGSFFDAATCRSTALETTLSLDVQDSITSNTDTTGLLQKLPPGAAVHHDLIVAEYELVQSYRIVTVSAIEKLNRLLDGEQKIGLAWKRFAIAISNLFAFEKDVENARIGDMKSTKHTLPYRKVTKKVVDESLRVLAKQKVDRSTPALKALSGMLGAYLADMSSVAPSVDAYFQELSRMATIYSNGSEGRGGQSLNTWDKKLKAMASSTLSDVQKHALRSFSSKDDRKECEHGSNLDGKRFLDNERLLRNSLTTLCRATPIRSSRMAWRFLHTEATQSALVHAAAASVREKINVVSKESVGRMTKRHLKEEREDRLIELSLIEKILNIGSLKQHGGEGLNGDDRAKFYRDEKVLSLARDRTGRWDAPLVIAVMDAVGIEDPIVCVEETTRELRMVRKYAIGLGDCLNRCSDAVQLLQEAIIGNKRMNDMENSIDNFRALFFAEISKVFSGAFMERGDHRVIPQITKSLLSRAGIDVNDPFGWRIMSTCTSNEGSRAIFTHGKIGSLVQAYCSARDTRIDVFLQAISGIIKEYQQRVEIVEGFVYMECVGIQLEKYFSQKRAQALSDFERKTDLIAALNAASRKRIPQLLTELRKQLDGLGPHVTQARVKETKEAHLESKQTKSELHELAMRRLVRAQETSTERALSIIELWSREEENSSARELKAIGEAMAVLERFVAKEDFDALVYRFPKRSTKDDD